jgi:hypothetical protein
MDQGQHRKRRKLLGTKPVFSECGSKAPEAEQTPNNLKYHINKIV